MPRKDRDTLKFLHRNLVPRTSTTIEDQSPIPVDEVWQMEWLIFADQNIGDNISGGFLLEWGVPGDFELIHAAFLTGATSRLTIKRAFEGDGAKFFRISRENGSQREKSMIALIHGFKRVGD